MRTYKVGDRVRSTNRYFSPGDIGTIVRIQPSHYAYPYYVRFDNDSGIEPDLFSADELVHADADADKSAILDKIIAIVGDPSGSMTDGYLAIESLLEAENLL